jgi:hypothetical protein
MRCWRISASFTKRFFINVAYVVLAAFFFVGDIDGFTTLKVNKLFNLVDIFVIDSTRRKMWKNAPLLQEYWLSLSL